MTAPKTRTEHLMTETVTEAMIEAGQREIAELCLRIDLFDADLRDIYLAMSRASQPVDTGVGEAAIKHMVNRFLCWPLPDPWKPDNGIENNRQPHYAPSWGTNLFDATQAEAMVRHMIEGLSITPPLDSEAVERVALALRDEADRKLNANAVNTYPPSKVEDYVDFAKAALLSLANPVGGEREAIVAWLRRQSDDGAAKALDKTTKTARAAYGGGSYALKLAADNIEAGEHLTAMKGNGNA